MQLNDIAVGAIVDRLGAVKAQIAALAEEESALKQVLIDSGESAIDGAAYRAAVSVVEKVAVDWKAIAERLGPSRQLVAAYSKPSSYVSVRVSARKS